MADLEDIAAEMERAETMLRSLTGEPVPAISVNSIDAIDAPFLGLIVSKLSPIIGNLLERRIINLLSEAEAGHGMRWIRQDPGFPDALLVNRDGTSTGSGYEVKAWYALSTEITGRFRESQNLLAGKDIRVILVAWMMSHVVYGSPVIVDVLSVSASSAAAARDLHYHQPPRYLIVEPGDTTARTLNLQQTNVNGYRIQDADAATLAAATTVMRAMPGYDGPPHSPGAQAAARELQNRFSYRLDTNFAKIDRIDHHGIEGFKTAILASRHRGRTLLQWARLLHDLGEEQGRAFEAAAAAILAVYEELAEPGLPAPEAPGGRMA